MWAPEGHVTWPPSPFLDPLCPTTKETRPLIFIIAPIRDTWLVRPTLIREAAPHDQSLVGRTPASARNKCVRPSTTYSLRSRGRVSKNRSGGASEDHVDPPTTNTKKHSLQSTLCVIGLTRIVYGERYKPYYLWAPEFWYFMAIVFPRFYPLGPLQRRQQRLELFSVEKQLCLLRSLQLAHFFFVLFLYCILYHKLILK